MSDYIKREDAIKAFDPSQRRDWYTPWIVETLGDLPSADVAPVRHGRWVKVYGEHISMGHRPWAVCCSECDKYGDYTNYCPNCGAKMDK